jgi:hypothetical protein
MRKSAYFLFALLLSMACAAQQVAPTSHTSYTEITGKQRLMWFTESTVGPRSLFFAGPFSAGWGTIFNSPEEYGTHWEGFGKRYGMRLTGVSTNNAIEVSLGAIWHEDPRYFRAPGRPFGGRVKHVIYSTFTAPGPDGNYRLAYARFAAGVGGNVMSNAWRPPSETDWQSTLLRPTTGLLGRFASDAISEFWPDIKRLVFKR